MMQIARYLVKCILHEIWCQTGVGCFLRDDFTMKILPLASALSLLSSSAFAGDMGMSIRDIPDAFAQVYKAVGDNRTKPTLSSCAVATEATRRSVCTYKLGSFMQLIAGASENGGGERLGEITMICLAKTDLDGLKCVTAMGAGIGVASDMPAGDRGKIIKAIFAGLDASGDDQGTVSRDGRKYTLQRVVGSLWFTIAYDAG